MNKKKENIRNCSLDNIKKLENLIGIKFHNQDLLKEALTHKSYAVEMLPPWGNNERLEFLGDSLLSAIVSAYLYKKYPEEDEGTLSRLRANLISRETLLSWAKEINLGKYIYLSRGEEASRGRERESILANAYEALVGAIYLDKGYALTEKFVLKKLELKKHIRIKDYKSRLQEIVQSKYKLIPEYKVLKESGPDHEKTFEIGVYFPYPTASARKRIVGRGIGKSKKEAEQEAAKNALSKITK